jgi:hypothetical protein
VTVRVRPPSARGRAVAVPPWIAAMDVTMASPSPKPSWVVRLLSRWNGWKMRSMSSVLMTAPVLATATRGHNRVQFLAEAVHLALLGGAIGVGAGVLATAVYASSKHELVVIPALAWAGGCCVAVVIGAATGLWPARRAARISPTQALWSM